jgi:DNA polymerase-3 subunit beta
VPYLIDPLSHMGCDMITVSLKDTHSGALMTIPEDEGFSYVVMPMRI